jgi:hypothetical protein
MLDTCSNVTEKSTETAEALKLADEWKRKCEVMEASMKKRRTKRQKRIQKKTARLKVDDIPPRKMSKFISEISTTNLRFKDVMAALEVLERRTGGQGCEKRFQDRGCENKGREGKIPRFYECLHPGAHRLEKKQLRRSLGKSS